MKPVKLNKDSFLSGVLLGLITITASYYLLTGLRTLLINYTGNYQTLRPPAVQLLAMLVNIILFRFLIINYKKEQTGKGLLFITVILTFIYFYAFNRVNNQ
jgi:hypothetical protein